jgi:hypothetical protein
MRIFVCGPLTSPSPREVMRNVNKAIDIGIKIWEMGHVPFIPHLTYFLDIRPQCKFNYDDYIKYSLHWLDLCDALFFIGPSKGANVELEYAKKKGLKIFRSLEEIPPAKETF